MNRSFLAAGLLVGCLAGCQSVRIVKAPGEYDTGVRFYRPKPYLLVTPADPTGRMVNLKLEYLPDYNEEYSAHLKGKKAAVALKDGWNLVGVNMAGPAEEKPPAPAPAVQNLPLPGMVVAATNVPMGFYEAIYEMAGPDKYLKGWRYIGFSVLAGAKPGVPGRTHAPVHCGPGMDDGLYGLVFFNGTMTFRRLEEIAANQLCPSYVRPTPLNPELPAPTALDRPPVIEGSEQPTGPTIEAVPTAPSPTTPPPLPPPTVEPGSTGAFRSTSTLTQPARTTTTSPPPLASGARRPSATRSSTASRPGAGVKLPKADASLSTASLGARPTATRPAAQPGSDLRPDDVRLDLPSR
jgi:hypothetical protein